MADPLTYLKQRSGDDWLIGYDSQAFFALAEEVLGELRSRPDPKTPLTILLAERNPLTFLAHFIAACAANCRLVLANPDWAPAEWQQVFELVQPDVIWGEAARTERQKAEGRGQKVGEAESAGEAGEAIQHSKLNTQHSAPVPHFILPTPHPSPLTPHILIPTGGTSGNIRFAIHTWETLMASVDGFCQYFEVEQVNSFCVLPLYHVSGLMQFLRSFTTGGRLVVLPFKAVERGDRSAINPEDFFLSLVPTQLQRLMDEGRRQEAGGRRQEVEGAGEAREAGGAIQNSKLSSAAARSATQNSSSTPDSRLPTPDSRLPWLSRFHTILLGGAPAWSDLLDRARSHRIRLAPTYGMTETASQIATLKPDDFLNGHTNAGHVLPHAQITIRNPSGDILPPHQIGTVTIQATSLAWGYYPRFPDATRATFPLTDALPSCQISCSGGLGELGPQKAGDRGEVPRTQSSNEAEMLAHQSLERREKGFQPDDLGYFDADGYLHIIGRHSDKIITGGENVFPAEVEAAIRSTNLVQDICVLGIDDRHWGQAIAAVYVPLLTHPSIATIQTALETKLTKFKRPKHWIAVAQVPRNAQGKVNLLHVEAIAKAWLSVATID
ncbi:MAG: 2-succinylbenzoate--CoA ligase [Lyngbya sp. HA4199-MV5]|jgi:O-succinylbenzoic acid--CoA ligase|nr:2-succinylbenzoate--CoA ligase [Lyngbya sp. HA4199-MV5]